MQIAENGSIDFSQPLKITSAASLQRAEAELERLLEAHKASQNRNQLPTYRPYTKQALFHRLGREPFSERLLMAGNQVGKTLSAGSEWAMHLTNRYPDWWDGATFDKPPVLWASGESTESTRDNPQRILMGPPMMPELWGTGTIPGDAVLEVRRRQGSVSNALDSVVVQWGGGGDVQAGQAVLQFKAYEQGREKWQGPTIDGTWFDEEPPEDIHSEGTTRTQAGQRSIFTAMTFTPLKGMSVVVRSYLTDADLAVMTGAA